MALQQSKNKVYAYDLHKKLVSKGEAYNDEAINVSIENILSTMYGERVFLLNFGSPLFATLFENLDVNTGNQLLDAIIAAIEKWEDRVIVDKNQSTIQIIIDNNTLIVTIAYTIIRTNLTGTFKKRIIYA